MVRQENPERAQRATIITRFTKLLEVLGPTAREVGELRGYSQRSRVMKWSRWIFKKKWRSSRKVRSTSLVPWRTRRVGSSRAKVTTKRKSRSSMVKLWRRWWSTRFPHSWAMLTTRRCHQKDLIRRWQGPCHVHGWDSEHIFEQNVVVPVLQIRKVIGEVIELIPKERVS